VTFDIQPCAGCGHDIVPRGQYQGARAAGHDVRRCESRGQCRTCWDVQRADQTARAPFRAPLVPEDGKIDWVAVDLALNVRPVALTRTERREVVRRGLEMGLTPHQIASRSGIHPDTARYLASVLRHEVAA
jgi:hypothetical protein